MLWSAGSSAAPPVGYDGDPSFRDAAFKAFDALRRRCPLFSQAMPGMTRVRLSYMGAMTRGEAFAGTRWEWYLLVEIDYVPGWVDRNDHLFGGFRADFANIRLGAGGIGTGVWPDDHGGRLLCRQVRSALIPDPAMQVLAPAMERFAKDQDRRDADPELDGSIAPSGRR